MIIALADGPPGLAGATFDTEAFPWPPPEEIRVVSGGNKGPELLDLPNDDPRPGEDLHTYRRVLFGIGCAGSPRRSYPTGYYELLRSAPPSQPALPPDDTDQVPNLALGPRRNR